MAGILLDSTNSGAIIAAVRDNRTWRGSIIRAAALYVDGEFPAPSAAFTALRTRVAVLDITVLGTVGSGAAKLRTAGDVETGNLDPATGAQWALDEKQRGAWPVLYSDRADKPATLAECKSLGMAPGPDFGLWTATLDGTFQDLDGTDLRLQPGMVAVQFAGADQTGIDADASALTAAGEKWLGMPASWETHAISLVDQLAALLREHA